MQQPGATPQGPQQFLLRERCKRAMVNRPASKLTLPGLFRACSAGELADSFPGALPQAVALRAFGALKPNLPGDASTMLCCPN